MMTNAARARSRTAAEPKTTGKFMPPPVPPFAEAFPKLQFLGKLPWILSSRVYLDRIYSEFIVLSIS
jgi:hypothetical protein